MKTSSQASRTGPESSGQAGTFLKAARVCARATGHPWAFGIAAGMILLWGVSGPLFGFSDTWQLVINTTTTIITFLMVFLIQNTQNRDTEALQLKLDELIRSSKAAHNAVLDVEELSAEELERIKKRYEAIAQHAREDLRSGKSDIGSPEVNEATSVSRQTRPSGHARARRRRQVH